MLTIWSPNKYTGRSAPIRLIVLHTTESAEVSNGAESIANYFAKDATNASSHIVVDNDSEVRCVADVDTAWAAPGANSDGLQLEMVGAAGQGTSGWSDAYSRAELERAANIVASWCRLYGIPVRHLSVSQVADGSSRGICGHVDVTNAFHQSTHTDPGPAFPWADFLARVQELTAPSAPTPTPPPLGGLSMQELDMEPWLVTATPSGVQYLITPLGTAVRAVRVSTDAAGPLKDKFGAAIVVGQSFIDRLLLGTGTPLGE